jgi:hypothetical protein
MIVVVYELVSVNVTKIQGIREALVFEDVDDSVHHLHEKAFGHGRIARGGHGLPKVLPEPAMPCSFMPLGPLGQVACGRLLPLWTPHAVHPCLWVREGRRRRGH